MTLKSVINDIADQADNFLDGVANRADAKTAIAEQLTIKYPTLNGAERTKVLDSVLSILDEEGFFQLSSGSGSDEKDAVDEG